MTEKEKKERNHLHNLWMLGKATMRQMDRAMELDRMASHEPNEDEAEELSTPPCNDGYY